MSKVKKIMLMSLCLALCGTMGGAMAVMASADGDTYTAPTDNLVANYGVETDAAGYSGNGATVEVSTDYAYEGNSSLKVSGRNSGTWNAYNVDVSGVEFDKWYEYSFYAYTTAEGGSDIAAQLSPWSCNADGAWLYTYVTGPWAHINANEWVEISMQFQFTVIDGAMYVKFLDAEGNENNALCKADNGDTAFEGNYTYNFVRMTFNASQGVDIYADNVVVTPVVENEETPDDGDTPVIEGPKGHAGGVDASLIPGNWLPNATFDNNLFSTSLNNDGVWYYNSPEKLTQNTEYSQDGTDYGCSAQLSNRQSAYCSSQVRSLNVWVDSVYEFAGYISASQATKAGFRINMWAFNEDYTDAEPEQRYPVVRWAGNFKEVKPGEWTYFNVLISWKRNAEDNTISLLIWERNEESAEIVAEYRTTECTGLSAFEFCFYTDAEDENYLSDLFFDNFTLINVHDSIFGSGNEGGEEGGNEGGEEGGVVIPGDDNSSTGEGNVTVPDSSNKDDNNTANGGIVDKLKGCFSTISGGIAAGATLIAAAFVCGKKRKD